MPSLPRARRFTAALLLLCGALILNGLLAYHNVHRLVALEQSREQLSQTREALDELDVSILTAQLAGRGYALTGQPDYLAEHSAALRNAHGAFATARQLARDEAQRLQLDSLEAHVMKAMSWVQQLIISREKGGLDAAGRMLADGRGVGFVPAARAALAQLDDASRERMRAEAIEIRRDLNAAIVYLAVFTLAGIVVALLAVWTVRHEFEPREKAE